jgi:hypothetical protein
MRRVAVLTFAIVAVLATLPAPSASAHISFVDVVFVQLDQQGRVVEIGGFIDCTPGEEFLLRVHYNDGDQKAVGRASGDCVPENGTGARGKIAGGQTFGGSAFWVTGRVDSPTGMSCTQIGVTRGQARTVPDGARKSFSDADFDCYAGQPPG